MTSSDRADVLVVGGGPAGLAAALSLARGNKSVIVCDGGTPRNAPSAAVHGYLGCDGVPPSELRARGIADLARYPSVTQRDGRVAGIDRRGNELVASLGRGAEITARRVLLATGIVDTLPKLPGFVEQWGRGVFDCPYCHGYEHRDERWGFVAPKAAGLRTVLSYLAWTKQITILTDGFTFEIAPDLKRELDHARIAIEPRKMARVVSEGGALTGVELEGGDVVALGALVYHPAARPSDLALMMGLAQDGAFLRIDARHETSMRGVYACGDLVAGGLKALFSAADGMSAAQSIVDSLTLEDAAAGR